MITDPSIEMVKINCQFFANVVKLFVDRFKLGFNFLPDTGTEFC